jgi:hypothetical protein
VGQLERAESGAARTLTRDGWTTAMADKGARLVVPLEARADGVRWDIDAVTRCHKLSAWLEHVDSSACGCCEGEEAADGGDLLRCQLCAPSETSPIGHCINAMKSWMRAASG